MEAVDKISVGVSKEKAGQNTQEAITENADGMKVSLGEKICYGVGDIGANLVWTTVASFLTIYCTDVAGIAAGVVGTLMLIARPERLTLGMWVSSSSPPAMATRT